MLGNIFSQMLKDDEESDDNSSPDQHPAPIVAIPPDKLSRFISIGLIILALFVRLSFLFFVENPQDAHPGWYEDTYHHWQIAHLTYTQGFKHGFLRLWDLKGMEYFWGLLHPLILGGLLQIFGPSIVVSRLLSLTCGSISAGLIFLLTARYFGKHVGLAAALIYIVNPVSIFSDASGMQEPLGIMILLSGLYFWNFKPFLSGMLIMLAGMVRAEFWVLGVGIVGMAVLGKEKIESKIKIFLGYLLVMVVYMKYLLGQTSNAIYPVYWNFLGNAAGVWQAKIQPTAEMLFVKNIYAGILIAVIIGLLLLLWKRPPWSVFFSAGLGNWLILSVTVGLTKYLLSYLSRFWVDRIMVMPYLFLAVWLSMIIFKVLGKSFLKIFAWILIFGIMGAIQLLWQPIWQWRSYTVSNFDRIKELAGRIGQVYQGGKVLIYEDRPTLTYNLVYNEKISGDKIVGEMFDPYYYMTGDPYDNWGANRQIIFDWLKKEDIRLIAITANKNNYLKLIEREPQIFGEKTLLEQWGVIVIPVKQEMLEAAAT